MDELVDEDVVYLAAYITPKRSIRRKKDEKARKKRTIWVRQIYKQSEKSGIFHNLVPEMVLGDRESISSKYNLY